MIISQLTLTNYRNHNYLTYNFQKGLNIITGENATGKTNVVEAINYLSIVRSFRTQNDADLIEKGKDSAEIFATIEEGDIRRKINIKINSEAKHIRLNGKPITKLSNLAKVVNVVVFEPKDVHLFKGLPKARRNFLDINISKKSPAYLDYLSRYEKVLKERNEILKSENPDLTLLDVTTELLVKLSGPIVAYRELYVKDINDILIKITRALTGESGKIKIHYTPFVKPGKDFNKNAKEAFKRALEGDLKRKVTSIGLHREDFSVSLNERDIAIFGSQGENRIIALALKLSPYFMIEDRDKRPIVVLDDVMSELDEKHQKQLINFLKKFEQVFITATELEVKDASHYHLKKK